MMGFSHMCTRSLSEGGALGLACFPVYILHALWPRRLSWPQIPLHAICALRSTHTFTRGMAMYAVSVCISSCIPVMLVPLYQLYQLYFTVSAVSTVSMGINLYQLYFTVSRCISCISCISCIANHKALSGCIDCIRLYQLSAVSTV